MTKFSRLALLPLAAALAASLTACNTNDLKPLTVQATSSTVMQGGSGVTLNASGGRKSDKVTWRLLPGATGTLTPSGDTRSAVYTPPADVTATATTTSIEAKMGDETQTFALKLQPPPASELVASLPAWWQAYPNGTSGKPLIQGEPRGFAPDGNGGYYVTYAAPVLKFVRVKAGADVAEINGLGSQGIIGGLKDGTLYLTEGSAAQGLTIRKRTPDGKSTVLTRTAAYDSKQGPVDGVSGAATAYSPRFAFDSNGNLYALDGSKVRKIAQDGSWSTLAGDGCDMASSAPKCPDAPVPGKGSSARLAIPVAIASDPAGTLYVIDGSYILKVTQAGDVTILAGGKEDRSVDGDSGSARFELPNSLAADSAGNVYVMDEGRLRRISSSGTVTTLAAGLGAFRDLAHPELYASRVRMGDNGTVEYLRAVDIRRVKVQ
ncbi:hypothetical protein GCM10027277_33500 [Pseudoduganella ginsengisoli]|uniref:Teneurin NHL domain-containing protein n=1 Tax=Pseudoduganella ginsengisoli TaxID=1462440 RepID=A0A6L6Q7A1_9BURK|nr:hypothetical protein [Pseudoduganella ginsengisoli]MTW05334.1 hypothetical protein [Pseudoduganella ginsengisoli]